MKIIKSLWSLEKELKLNFDRINSTIFLARIIPKVTIFTIISITFFFYWMGRTDLAKKGFIFLGIPILIASILAVLKESLFIDRFERASNGFDVKNISFIHMFLLFLLLYIISAGVAFASFSRPIGYFFVVACMAGLVLLEILSAKEGENKDLIILPQIVFLFLNISLSYTLKYPMPIFTTDIFFHMGYIKELVNEGHITNFLGNYEYYPGFHIFNSVGLLLTGWDIKTSYLVLNGLFFSISIILIYIIINYSTNNKHLSLLTALLFIFIRPTAMEGMDVLTRTSSYIYLLLILYLLLHGKDNLRLQGISVFLILPVLISHTTTIVFFIIILFLFFLISHLLQESQHIKFNYILLLAVSFLTYSLYVSTAISRSWIKTILMTREAVGVTNVISTSFISTLINNLDYMIVSFFAIIGIIALIYRGEKKNDFAYVLGIGTYIMFPLFFPDIAALFTAFLGSRMTYIISPFIAFVTAAGISKFFIQIRKYQNNKHNISIIIILISFVGFFFFSSCMTGSTTDLVFLPNLVDQSYRYHFIQSELDSFSFLLNHMKIGNHIYSDYIPQRYFEGFLNLTTSDSIKALDPNSVEPISYFIFRDQEYKASGFLMFEGNYRSDIGFYTPNIRINYKDFPNLSSNWSKGSKIYDNEEVYLFESREDLR